MAWCLLGAKSRTEANHAYCWLDPWEQLPLNFIFNIKSFIQENEIEYAVCKMAAALAPFPCIEGSNPGTKFVVSIPWFIKFNLIPYIFDEEF